MDPLKAQMKSCHSLANGFPCTRNKIQTPYLGLKSPMLFGLFLLHPRIGGLLLVI